MAKFSIKYGDSSFFSCSCDLIFTDPPFDMCSEKIHSILNCIECDHAFIISTMKQMIDLMSLQNCEWVFNFDVVLDAVVPKKSKSIRQPNYTHSNGFYLTRNKSRSIFNRKLRQRSDTFDNKGYWPTIFRAPRNRMHEHGMAKNEQCIVDILGCFEAQHIYDPFAGSGTVAMACFELNKDCTMVESDKCCYENLMKKFRFLGVFE